MSDNTTVANSIGQGAYDYLVKSSNTLESIVERVKEKLGVPLVATNEQRGSMG